MVSRSNLSYHDAFTVVMTTTIKTMWKNGTELGEIIKNFIWRWSVIVNCFTGCCIQTSIHLRGPDLPLVLTKMIGEGNGRAS